MSSMSGFLSIYIILSQKNVIISRRNTAKNAFVDYTHMSPRNKTVSPGTEPRFLVQLNTILTASWAGFAVSFYSMISAIVYWISVPPTGCVVTGAVVTIIARNAIVLHVSWYEVGMKQ